MINQLPIYFIYFRAAAGSGDGNTDRKSYQLPPGAAGLAVRTAVSINISFLKNVITSQELKLVFHLSRFVMQMRVPI